MIIISRKGGGGYDTAYLGYSIDGKENFGIHSNTVIVRFQNIEK